jgi:hypothetical protein
VSVVLDLFDGADRRDHGIEWNAQVTQGVGKFPMHISGQAVVVGNFNKVLALLHKLGLTVEHFDDGLGFTGRFHSVLDGVQFVLFD